MNIRESKIADGGWLARSVLECGSPLPLLTGIKHSADTQSARGLAHSKTWRIFGTLLAFLAITISIRAQTYSIDWYKISGGGGTSTGGTYSVSGTIGQHDASSAMTGGQYSLTGGFWSLYAVQTPGAPVLTIKLTNNVAMVFWPSPSTGWTLQENTNSLSSSNWFDHPFPQDNGAIKYILANPPTGNRFYRLKR